MVGYTLKDSKQNQGWREYKPNVRNPQSDGQMVQRVKMAAVNNLYRDLKEIIQRGMEATAYGYAARKKWLSLALGQQFEGPWIIKGYTMGLPIKGVPISVGSLPQVVSVATSHTGGVATFLPFDPSGVFEDDELATIGQLSQAFVLGGYQEGDQVTFVTGYVPLREAFTWVVKSFIIDTSSTEDIMAYFGGSTRPSVTTGSIGDTDGALFEIGEAMATPVDAQAVIVSRDGQTVGSHLRSTAYFAMNQTAAANWYSEGAYERAKRSYLTTDATNTNWEQDPQYAPSAPGETRANTNASTPVAITVDAWRDQGGFAQVHDATNNIWRYVYNEDVRSTAYHMWLKGNLTGTVWTGTGPSGAETTAATRFVYGQDAQSQDIQFGNWLIDDIGYSPRSLVLNV